MFLSQQLVTARDPRNLADYCTGRILRYLASVDMISETEEDLFAATNVTKVFAQPGYQAGIRSQHVSPTIDLLFN